MAPEKKKDPTSAAPAAEPKRVSRRELLQSGYSRAVAALFAGAAVGMTGCLYVDYSDYSDYYHNYYSEYYYNYYSNYYSDYYSNYGDYSNYYNYSA